jgi:hypothetical protein
MDNVTRLAGQVLPPAKLGRQARLDLVPLLRFQARAAATVDGLRRLNAQCDAIAAAFRSFGGRLPR